MTTHVIVDNDGHYTVDVFCVDTKHDTGERFETLMATLKPGEKTAERQLTLWDDREVVIRECSPMRKD